MKPSLQVRLSQHLALTPQLQQSIRLLQLSTLELHQEVEQMLEQNPFLEALEEVPAADGPAPAEPTREQATAADDSWDSAQSDGGGAGPGAGNSDFGDSVIGPGGDAGGDAGGDGGSGSGGDVDGAVSIDKLDFSAADHDWESGGDRDDFEAGGDTRTRNGALEDDDSDWSERNSVADSLTEHLRRQLLGMRLDEDDQLLVEALIDSLNEDGYLADSLDDIAERLMQGRDEAGDELLLLREELLERLRCALAWLHSLEPSGVGARDLSECLCLQLRELPESADQRVALLICQKHLDILARRDMKKLVSATGADEELIREAQSLILSLEPKPGRRFAKAEANIVVPDVIVQKAGRGWKVVLNPDVMPKLRINDMYAQVLRQHRSNNRGNNGADGGAGLSARLQEARWFVKNILQRFDTIQRVSQAIVERQKGFLTHGEIAMKPLVLREIADELGLHESTISRVTTAKYMNTPFGTFELKYFFGSSLNTEAGGNASSTAVRALIKQFISAEDVKKPLSDSQLSTMLEEQGIQVARRTVAKYREALKIAPANLRKSI
jgi:RNA polymerase sigma-54 factor